ncbi:MAG: hypothetical protein GDA53_07010 [Rhodobacteraceae bacterium]|nr:hypothetical protein [Paracoccaceae bacterium]
MRRQDALKLFGLNNLLIEADLRKIERAHDIDLGHRGAQDEPVDETYYPQFAERIRDEAARMAAHYRVFYCLENSIRDLIVERLEEEHGSDWWDKAAPEDVRKQAAANVKKEIKTGVTRRSDAPIDFTTFGELGEIIKSNWAIFGDTFRDITALEKILATLNTLRGPIAHCTALAEDEETRLRLTLRDWFRQME